MARKSFKSKLQRVFAQGSANAASSKDTSVEALQAEVVRLQQSLETLSIINDLAIGMSEAASPEEAVEKLVDHSMRAVHAEQAAVTLLDSDERSTADEMKTQVRVFQTSVEHIRLRISDSLLGWMMINKKSLVINDPRNDDRFRGLNWDDTIKSVMCLPLMIDARLIGLLAIYNKQGQTGFTESDEELATIIAAHSAQLIQNARLVKEKTRIEEQFNLAYDIQLHLLPESPPRIEGYDIAGKSTPAQSVGGDYFDFIPIDEVRNAVCLGDVSGKGLPAALLMASVQATLRAQTMVDIPVDELINHANKLLCRCTNDENFVTLWYGVLDKVAHEIDFCNAGHEPPFLMSANGAVRRLGSTGLALGVIDNFTYRKNSISMEPGDVLVVYSDGVTDMEDKTHRQFGQERLEALIAEHHAKSAHALVEFIMKAAVEHAGSAPQFDDLTLVVVKRTK
jgi:sigma-B regulation protein RsbU (phosphoserine phosphatase)